ICPEKVVQVTDAVPWYSRTVHPRVHRQVPGTPGGSPVRDAGGVVQRGSELSIRRLSQFLREERRADQHRTDNAGATKLQPLLKRRDAEPPGIERLQRTRSLNGAQAIRVRLHHGKDRTSGVRGDGAPILYERAEIDVDPGASRKSRLTCHRSGG